MSKSKTGKCKAAGLIRTERGVIRPAQAWFNKRRKRNRTRNRMQKESRKINR